MWPSASASWKASLFSLLLIAFHPRVASSAWPGDSVNVALCTAFQRQQATAMVTDGAGGAIVAWHDARTLDNDIYARRVDAAGVPQWTADGVALCTQSGAQRDPRAVEDGAGGAIVVWVDQRSGGSRLFARRIDASGVPQWAPNGVEVASGVVCHYAPAVTADGAGGVILTWWDERSGPGAGIYAQRLSATGAPQWTTAGVAVRTGVATLDLPHIASDGAGGAIVAWMDRHVDVNGDLYAQRLNGSGTPQWAADGVPVCTVTGSPYGVSVVTDGAGGAILAWSDARSRPEGDPFAQRIDAGGVARWTPDGNPVATVADALEGAVQMASDDLGGAVFAWRSTGLAGSRIDAQRLDALGARQWTAAGVPVCVTHTVADAPTIAPDGAGGLYLAWPDYRNDPLWDLYAQHIHGNAATAWTVNGLAVSTAPHYQQGPLVVPGLPGTAIIAWTDSRSDTLSGNETNIYAHRVPFSMTLGVSLSRTDAGIRLSPVYPNPIGREARFSVMLAHPAGVRVDVMDVSGRHVAELTRGWLEAGTHPMSWKGTDRNGGRVAPGVYWIQLMAGRGRSCRKVAVMR